MIRFISNYHTSSLSRSQRSRRRLRSIRLKKGDIAIDCGANTGGITEELARRGATVYAFEPNPHAFSVLTSRFKNHAHIHCIPAGVGGEMSRQKLYFHEHSDNDEVAWSTGSSLFESKSNVLSEKYCEVDIVDLCQFIESLHDRVRVLKLDVEGAECEVLTKLISTGLIHRIDNVFAETHDHKIPDLAHATNVLRERIDARGLNHVDLNWE
jgi:FkbM family methyltransferase